MTSPGGAGAPLLEIEDLTVAYGGVQALEGVSLVVKEQAAVCLLGPNGAGKTSLLRAISGLLGYHGGRIVRGQVRYAGRTVTGRDAGRLVRGGIAQVLEGRHVFGELDGRREPSCRRLLAPQPGENR